MDIEYQQEPVFSQEIVPLRNQTFNRDNYQQQYLLDKEITRAKEQGFMDLTFINQEISPIFTSNLLQTPLIQLNLDLCRQNWGQKELSIFCSALEQQGTLKDLKLSFAQNGIQDSGSVELSQAVSCLRNLQTIELNLQRNALNKKGFAVMESLNQLSCIQKIYLDVRGNQLELEEEMKQLLPKFKNEGIFQNIQSFKVCIDEIKQTDQKVIQQVTSEQAHLEQIIKTLTSQLQHLIQVSAQYQNSPPHQQQIQLQANTINQQLQSTQTQLLKLQADAQKNKKSGICRVLEIILKFTTNLRECSLVMPGQLFTSREWEFLGTLLRNKPSKMTSFSFEGLNHNSHCQEMEYCFYQIGKLKGLTSLSLMMTNLQATSLLNLSRFLSDLPALRFLKMDLSSPDAFTQQTAVYMDLAQVVKQSPQIQNLSLSLGHSLLDNNTFSSLINSISSAKQLNSLHISVRNCQDLTDPAVASLIGMINISQSLKNLSLDLSMTNFTSRAVTALFQSISASQAQSVHSLVLNYIPLGVIARRQPFTKEENLLINQSLSKMQILKKCIVTFPHNPLLSTFKELAAQQNRLLLSCQLAKQSIIFKVLRKDIAFQVMDFLL